MSTSYLFQPHVHGLEAVVTPDILIDDLFVAVVSGAGIDILPVPIDRLTMDNGFQVAGSGSTVDAALVLIGAGSGMLVGIASDHRFVGDATGRMVCAKPICREVWRFADVADHAARLVVRGLAVENNLKSTVQEGAVADWLRISDVVSAVTNGPEIPSGVAVLCTGLAITSITTATEFGIEIEDPVLDRRITHGYALRRLASARTIDRT